MRFPAGVIILLCWIPRTRAYPWGTDTCGAPNHGVSRLTDNSAFNVVLDDTNALILSSTKAFRGFLLTTSAGLKFSAPSANSQLSSVCGDADTALMHSSPASRTLAKGTVNCASIPGESFTVTAYIVMSYNRQFGYLSKTLRCPSNQSTSPDAGSSNVSSTQGTPGQLSSLNMLTLEWTPTFTTNQPDASHIKGYLNTGGSSTGWVGIGFGYSDFSMDGGKKAVVLSLSGSTCSVGFYTLVSHNVQQVAGLIDPWNVSAKCTFLSRGLASFEFKIGGSSSITLPPRGTQMYTLIAGGSGSSLGNHGSKWDYKRFDYLTGTNLDATTSVPVDPYYLTHGLIFILAFAILMPLTAFLILHDRARFYNAHKYIGILIISLVVAGWVVLRFASEEGVVFSSDPNGLDHKTYGGIALIAAAVVCVGGVILWVIRLPACMKKIVRYAHAIGGIALAIYGPYTVWKGWVLLEPLKPVVSALSSAPWLWLSVAIGGGVVLLTGYILKCLRGGAKKKREYPVMNQAEIDSKIAEGKLILLVDNAVCEIPKSFSHPGGRVVLDQFQGKEVGRIMAGIEQVEIRNRMRFVAHSGEAFKLAEKFRIGSIGEGSAEPEHAHFVKGIIVSRNLISSATDFPVRLFRVKVADGELVNVQVGSRVYVSIPSAPESSPPLIQRPYTVFRVDRGKKTIDFAIKIYPNGRFTSQLNILNVKDSLSLSFPPVAPPPIPRHPSLPSMLIFLAGGTGMVPMLAYFSKCSEIALGGVLLWWVRSEQDLFLQEDLETWTNSHNLRISLFFTQPVFEDLSSPPPSNRRPKPSTPVHHSGRISASAIKKAFGHSLPVHASEIVWIMSGPEGFITSAQTSLDELGVPANRIVSLD